MGMLSSNHNTALMFLHRLIAKIKKDAIVVNIKRSFFLLKEFLSQFILQGNLLQHQDLSLLIMIHYLFFLL